MSGIYTNLISTLVFPLHERLKGHDSVSIRKTLEETQWYSQERIKALQQQKLQGFIQKVVDHVPYYRNLFNELHLKPKDIQSANDLQKLPFLTKSIIRENQEALKSDINGASLSRFNTGGSSGEPLIFFLGKERISHDVAAKWRATRWWGVDIGDPELVVWGSPIELGTQDRVRKLRDTLLRTELLPAFEMSDDNLDRFVGKIHKFRPKMLFGYPSSISLIANHGKKSGIPLDQLGIEVVFVTSERLYEEQREQIEHAFGCPVANGYGGRDAGFIAHQCPEGGMHLSAEDIVVEIVDSEGRRLPPGRAGEVVVTHLATGEYPFIRYRTGDVAVLDDQPCSCGRGLPLLKEIQGRTTDFIVAEDGTVMHGLALIYVLRDVPGIQTFKIIQESRSRTRILIVADRKFESKSIETIKQGIGNRLGQGVKIEVQLVEQIPREASGKYRYVVSQIA